MRTRCAVITVVALVGMLALGSPSTWVPRYGPLAPAEFKAARCALEQQATDSVCGETRRLADGGSEIVLSGFRPDSGTLSVPRDVAAAMLIAFKDFAGRAESGASRDPDAYAAAADPTDAGTTIVYLWKPLTRDRGGAAEYELRGNEIVRVSLKR